MIGYGGAPGPAVCCLACKSCSPTATVEGCEYVAYSNTKGLSASDWGALFPLPQPVNYSNGEPGCMDGGYPTFEFAPCITGQGGIVNTGCACPMECVTKKAASPGFPASACEFPCQSGADCPLNTFCKTGPYGPPFVACEPVTCTDAGTACLVADAGTGTCLPMWTYTGPQLYCFQGGAAQGACDPNPYLTRADLASACPAGQFCVPQSLDAGSCALVCDPADAGDACPAGTHCGVVVDGMPSFGACVACLPHRGACQQDSDCCSGTCAPGCSFDWTQSGWAPGCQECQ